VAPAGTRQLARDEYFRAESEFWRAIYTAEDVYSVIHQYRESLLLSWVHDLELPAGATALEVGCGAGLTAVELAARGLRVEATDAVEAMVDIARSEAAAAGVADAVRVTQADAHMLDFGDKSFDLVIAMDVIPWLESPATALHEIVRVLKPAGTLFVNCDNAGRLDHSLDPLWNRRLRRLRHVAARVLPGSLHPAPAPRVRQHSIAEFDSLVRSGGLRMLDGKTFGFGPFTFLGRPVVPQALAVRLHRRLQRRADRGSSWLASRGAQFIVAARKP
jgi:2-polyprenyl-3-methyl-5-hydroxy-6-metoxy-1,4-benzoquinol methylase